MLYNYLLNPLALHTIWLILYPKYLDLKKIQIVFFFALFLVAVPKVLGQAPKKIIVEHSDFADVNQVEIPDAFLLTGNVRVNHDGVVLTCNKAYYFQKENYIKAFGNVQLVQGDTLFLNIS